MHKLLALGRYPSGLSSTLHHTSSTLLEGSLSNLNVDIQQDHGKVWPLQLCTVSNTRSCLKRVRFTPLQKLTVYSWVDSTVILVLSPLPVFIRWVIQCNKSMAQNRSLDIQFSFKTAVFPFSPFPICLCTSSKKKVRGVIEFALLFHFQLRKSDGSSSLPNDE